MPLPIQRCFLVLGFALAVLVGSWERAAQGADPAFVGVLSLAVEPEVAQQLGIPDDVRAKLVALVDERETEALELALQIKDLPLAERTAKLAPFVAESEKRGLALLSDQQKQILLEMRVARAGTAGLLEPAIAEKLGLTRVQTLELNRLLTEMQTATAGASEEKRRIAKAYYEPKLAAVLTKEQKAAWEQLAGGPAGLAVGGAPATAAPTGSASAAPLAAASGDPAPGSAGNGGAPRNAPSPDGKLRFNFRYAPWKDVLDWFATQADYSLVMKAPPQGTFNYSDRRAYTPAEAIDLINSVLLTEGYTLVRRERMLLLINLEDGIPPELVPIVKQEELDSRGNYELVKCVFQLSRMTPEKAEAEVRKMIGPQGAVVPLLEAKQLMVTETAGKLRLIRGMIEAVESPEAPKDETVVVLNLTNVSPSEFLTIGRPLLGIPDGTTSTPDNSLRLAIDELGSRVLATGSADRIERLQEIVKLIDAGSETEDAGPAVVDQPQLKIYPITQADPAAVLQVLQTILAGEADVRLTVDPKTGSLVALAKPDHHATIKATLDQMQRDGTSVEVIKLRTLDPQAAVLNINKLFGATDIASAANAPKVDADPINMQLMIRGTAGQIQQIRDLLEKMGEVAGGEELATAPTARTTLRMIPLPSRTARSVLEQVEAIWSAQGHGNAVRIVAPTQNNIPAGSFGARPVVPQAAPQARPQQESNPAQPGVNPVAPAQPSANPVQPGAAPPAAAPPAVAPPRDDERSTRRAPRGPFYFVSEPLSAEAEIPSVQEDKPKLPEAGSPPSKAEQPADDAPLDVGVIQYVQQLLSELDKNGDMFIDSQEWQAGKWQTPAESSDLDKDNRLSQTELYIRIAKRNGVPLPASLGGSDASTVSPDEPPSKPGAEIVVTLGPNGIIIASEDLDALDEFERLFRGIAETMASGNSKEFTVFYLKYAKADVAAALLQQILGGGTPSTDTDGGASLMGDLAAGMLGDMGGGLFGSLLGGGGGGGGGTSAVTTSGSVSIIPDARLNALVVQASPRDLDTIEQLLKIVDQPFSPEGVQTVAAPRFIPVFNGSADEMAVVVRQVYAGRIQADAGQARQPSPEDFVRALRGSRGGGSSQQNNKGEEPKMTIGVDMRTNSLIVTAPDYLFDEVKALVAQLDTDTIAADADETVKVVTLKRTNSDLIQRSLTSMLGPTVTANTTTAAAAAQRTGSSSSSNRNTSNRSANSSGSSFQPQSQNFQRELRQRMEMFNAISGGSRGGRSSRGGFGGDSGRSFGGGSRGSRGSGGFQRP